MVIFCLKNVVGTVFETTEETKKLSPMWSFKANLDKKIKLVDELFSKHLLQWTSTVLLMWKEASASKKETKSYLRPAADGCRSAAWVRFHLGSSTLAHSSPAFLSGTSDDRRFCPICQYEKAACSAFPTFKVQHPNRQVFLGRSSKLLQFADVVNVVKGVGRRFWCYISETRKEIVVLALLFLWQHVRGKCWFVRWAMSNCFR